MRLFVSVDLDDLDDDVAAAQARLPDVDSLRFVDPADAHVTLKFLGAVDRDRRDAVDRTLADAVSDADVAPFDVELGGFGVFPSLSYVSVVWVGVRAGSDELTRLHESCERELTALGFDPADHDFTPHVTLARMSDARGKAAVRRVVTDEDPPAGRTTVSEVRLTESLRDGDGPTYRTVARYSL
jgi:2'-5' RNA ligase